LLYHICLAIGIVDMWFPLLLLYKGSSVCRLNCGALGMLLALEAKHSCVELGCAILGSTMSYGARTWPNSVPSYILALRVVWY